MKRSRRVARDVGAEDLRRFVRMIEEGDRQAAVVLGDAVAEMGYRNLGRQLGDYAEGAFRSWRVLRRRLDEVLAELEAQQPERRRLRALALQVAKARGKARRRAVTQLCEAVQRASFLAWTIATGRRVMQRWEVHALHVVGSREGGYQVIDSRQVTTIAVPAREQVVRLNDCGSVLHGWTGAVRHQADEEDLWRSLKKAVVDERWEPSRRLLPRYLPRSSVDFYSESPNHVEVSDARTGAPIFELVRRSSTSENA